MSPAIVSSGVSSSPSEKERLPSGLVPSLDLTAILLGEELESEAFTDEELIPVRMLNEFTYCPRLAYLEWVQGEFADNLDTRQGTFGHRNVDKPSTRPFPVEAPSSDAQESQSPDTQETPSPDACEKTRSVMLSAYREGLVAKLDLLERDGAGVTPVEYKKGAIPDNPDQAWEPERVQLCAQGLILRENGYTCESGELYYIESRHRVTVPFDEALVMRTRQLIQRLREMGRSKQMPPPLVDSPKCPRCSLVGICLPDETNLLMQEHLATSAAIPDSNPEAAMRVPSIISRESAVPVRRLLPARDDALPIYVKEQGAFVGKDGERLVVRHREAKLISVPLIEVSQVSLFGNVQMSSQALREIVDRGIPVCHFSYGGWFHAITTGHVQKNIELRIAQFAIASDPIRSLKLAKGFISAKIKNCRTLLRRHGKPDLNSEQPIETTDTSRSLNDATVQDIRNEITDTQRANDLPILNPLYDAHKPAVPEETQRANDLPILNPSHDAHKPAVPDPSYNAHEPAVPDEPQRANDLPILNPSYDAHEPAVPDRSYDAREPAVPDAHEKRLRDLAELLKKVDRAASAETLLGLEGMAAKLYFAGFSKILKGGAAFEMNGRNRRPPRDPVNAILSFVYALLTKEVMIALQTVGFDPLLGFFHKPRYGRPSLALDLAEEFRPIIADSTALMAINNGEVSASSFLSRAGAVALTETGRKAVIAAFERRLEQEITHPIFGYKISYRRVLEVQARLLSRVVLGELDEYPGFCTR